MLFYRKLNIYIKFSWNLAFYFKMSKLSLLLFLSNFEDWMRSA